MCVCVCVVSHSFWTSSSLDVPQCYLHRGTNLFKCHEEVLYLQPFDPTYHKRFDIFSPITGGCSEGLGVF